MGLFPKKKQQEETMPPAFEDTPVPGSPSKDLPPRRALPPAGRSPRPGGQKDGDPRPTAGPPSPAIDAPTVPIPGKALPPSGDNQRIPRPAMAPRPASPAKAHAGNDLESMLADASRKGASDLHITRDMPPIIRLDGRLKSLEGWPILSREDCNKLIAGMLTREQKTRFDEEWELDLSLEYPQVGRFRVNLHRQRGTVEGAFRVVNETIRPLRQLNLPPITEELARRKSGLMVVTGPTGSGKTTTLAAIIDQINNERECMIVTVEDPIEYVHKNRRSIVKQREVTSDTHGFAPALRHVLRQDPDVIVIGEMRDLETIQTSLISAETGHMVFSTLHTPDAVQTVDRIIDVFPPHHQDQTRIQLANTLESVLAQQLIPMPGSQGRVVAVEIMVANSAVRKTIRSGKTEQLMTIIQTSYDLGMISMDKSLKNLYLQGLISYDDAISRAKFPDSFDNI